MCTTPRSSVVAVLPSTSSTIVTIRGRDRVQFPLLVPFPLQLRAESASRQARDGGGDQLGGAEERARNVLEGLPRI